MKRNVNVGYRGMERKAGLEFHGALPDKPKGGRHPEDVAGCSDCGMELKPKEEAIGLCKDCAGKQGAIHSKIDARMGKGIIDYIDIKKGVMSSIGGAIKQVFNPAKQVGTGTSSGHMRKLGMATCPHCAGYGGSRGEGKRGVNIGADCQHCGGSGLIQTRKSILDYIDLVKAMKHTPVDSGNIKSVGYHEPSRTMHIGFHHEGAVYEYDDVPPEAHKALMNAESIGKHFAKHVRMNYAYRRIKGGEFLTDIEKARSKPWRSEKGKEKIHRTMHEYKHGELRSGGKGEKYPKVQSREQAVAIALAQARKAGRKKSLDGIIDYIVKARR